MNLKINIINLKNQLGLPKLFQHLSVPTPATESRKSYNGTGFESATSHTLLLLLFISFFIFLPTTLQAFFNFEAGRSCHMLGYRNKFEIYDKYCGGSNLYVLL
jgi:hypothetical protein